VTKVDYLRALGYLLQLWGKIKMRIYHIAFVFLIFLILTSPVNEGESFTIDLGTPSNHFVKAYITHAPITIVSDSDFANQASLEGWEGNGSAVAPYIIENYTIYAPGSTPAISITWISESTHYIIRNCSVSGFNSLESNTGAIQLFQGNGVVSGCEIFNCTEGMYIQNKGKTIENNTFWDCSEYALTGKSAYYALVDGNIFDVSGTHAMYWQQCDNSVIENNQFLANITGGPSHQLEDQNSVNITIRDNLIITSEGDFFLTSDDVQFYNNHVQVYDSYGLMLRHNQGFTVNNCVFEKVGGVSYSKGIFAAGPVSENIVIANSSFLGLGLTVWDIMNCSVYNCSIVNAYQESVDIEQMLGTTTIYNNTIRNSVNRGIFIDYRSVGVQVYENIVEGISEGDGIQLRSNSTVVFNNTVYNCQTGIRVDLDGYFNVIYNNYLYDNTNNAKDDGTANNWDNGTIGNHWDDYSGSGFYYIPGSGSGIDHFPMKIVTPDSTNPILSSPDDIVWFIGSDAVYINWIAYDDNPYYYEIRQNGTIITWGFWNTTGEVIQVTISNLTIGVYEFEVLVSDIELNNATDLVVVFAMNEPIPLIISNPPDIWYIVGETGNLINWTLLSGTPESLQIYRNGSLLIQTDWVGENFILDIDNLALGSYNYTIKVTGNLTVYDIDTVWVYVIEVDSTIPTTTITTTNITSTNTIPEFVQVFTFVITIGSVSVIVIVLVLIYRSRSSGG